MSKNSGNLKDGAPTTVLNDFLDGKIQKKPDDLSENFQTSALLPKLPERVEKPKIETTPKPSADSIPKPVNHVQAVDLLGRLLHMVMAFRMGDHVDCVDAMYDYDEDEECHVFKLVLRKQIAGAQNMTPEMRYILRSDARDKVTTFLEELDLLSDEDYAQIFPEEGEIFIDTKMDFLKLLKRYLEAADITVLDVHSLSLPKPELPEEFKEAGSPDFVPAQYFHEVVASIGNSVSSDIAKEEALPAGSILYGDLLKNDLLKNVFYMPYANMNTYRTYAAAIEQDIPPIEVHVGMLVALTEQAIKFEDGLDDTRDEDLNLDLKPLRLSIN